RTQGGDMRDVGREFQRRRLQRYQPASPAWGRRGRWLAAFVGLWLLYSVFLSDHGFYRIWRLQEQNRRTEAELASINREIDELDSKLKNPEERRQREEVELRSKRMAKPGEIIYDVKQDTTR